MKETSNSVISVTRDERLTSAPNSKGNQIKWRTRDGYWLKADDLGYEGLAETAAAQLLRNSNILHFAWYDICTIHEEDVEYRGCVSKDFLSEGEQLFTLYRLYEANGLDPYFEFDGKSALQRLSGLIDSVTEWTSLAEFGTWIGRLLEFDAFILNEDRHLQNIAVIQKPDESFRLMPVFDNGAAFLSDTRRDYPLTASATRLMDKVKSKPIVTSFDKQLGAVREVVGLSLKFRENYEINLSSNESYDPREINRVNEILGIQSKRYPYLFDDSDSTTLFT